MCFLFGCTYKSYYCTYDMYKDLCAVNFFCSRCGKDEFTARERLKKIPSPIIISKNNEKKMKYLKEHDPITCNEMTTDHTGSYIDLDGKFIAYFYIGYIGLFLFAIVFGCIVAKLLFL